MTEHNHSHDHEGHEHITLVDDQGNETLYEILLTVDGQEEFGRNYVLLYPAGVSEDEDVELHRKRRWNRRRVRTNRNRRRMGYD